MPLADWCSGRRCTSGRFVEGTPTTTFAPQIGQNSGLVSIPAFYDPFGFPHPNPTHPPWDSKGMYAFPRRRNTSLRHARTRRRGVTGVVEVDLESLANMMELAAAKAFAKLPVQTKEELVVSKAWTFQDSEQVKASGKAKASWYVGFYDDEGRRVRKSCGPGPAGRKAAIVLRAQVESDLLNGQYVGNTDKTWDVFRAEYEEKVLTGLANRTSREIRFSLNNFERIARPKKVSKIKAPSLAGFAAKRRKENGLKPGSVIAPASVNKDLRHLRAALNVAHDWGYLPIVPKIRMEREPKKLPRYIPPEEFAKLYQACDVATMPSGLPYPAGEWWRGLIVFGYMTGWRVSELLALRREDLNLETGEAITRAEDNKGKRDERVKLHPVVIEHLRKLPAFQPKVLPWPHHERTLWVEFHRIQAAAGIGSYGFHDLRRAFATLNADRMTGDALQVLMRHKSYDTTKRYISVARQLNAAVESLYVPDLGRAVGQ